VHRFDRRENQYQLIHLEGNFQLPSPIGLVRGENDSVLVTDSALGGVFVIKPGAEFAVRMTLTEPLRQPTGIAFDDQARKLYVVDTLAHCIKVYAADGTYLTSIGQRGEADGEFNFPTMLWRDHAHLLVTDSLNFRVQLFDTQGHFISKFGQMGDNQGEALRQKGVATDSFGHVYLVDALLNGVQIFDPSGQLLLSMGGQGEARGEFWLPAGIFIGADDTIYVADTYNRRVQVFRYVGGPT
jgi:sugar lactone lactonase YvrE